MQRRIFFVRGEPFTAARDGFIETHGTLAALIEGYRPTPPDRSAEAEVAPIPAQVVATDMEASAVTPDGALAAAAQRHDKDAPPVKPRKAARAPRPKSPPAAADTAAVTAEAPEADGTTAELGAAPTRAPRGRVAGRRAGEPPTPRWMTAGKERRGRLK
jgi:hypothetical protein